MAPGDMLLRVNKVAGYNNLIIISTEKQRLGANIGLNKDDAPPDAENDTGEKGLVKAMGAEKPSEATNNRLDAAPAAASAKPDLATTASTKADHENHEDEKTALVVGGIAIGLGLLWFLR